MQEWTNNAVINPSAYALQLISKETHCKLKIKAGDAFNLLNVIAFT